MQADGCLCVAGIPEQCNPSPSAALTARLRLVHCIPAWQMAWMQLVEGQKLLLLQVMGVPAFAAYLPW